MTRARTEYTDPMDDFLDRPIAYNPAFRRITGSTVAGIFLSQAWYWSKRHREDDGWFYKSGKEWTEETGLSRWEQETARKHCQAARVTQEKLKGVPATLFYRVDKHRVYELLGVQFVGLPQTEFDGLPQTSSRDSRKQDGGIPANINNVSEIPSEIPLRGEILRAAETLLETQSHKWRQVESELLACQFSRTDGTIFVTGLGARAEYYQSRYTKSIERALVGILDEKVAVSFCE